MNGRAERTPERWDDVVMSKETSPDERSDSTGWSWPALGPGTGLPVVAGQPHSVSGPVSVPALYLLITGAWLILAALALFVVIRIVALLLLLLGLLMGHGPGQTQLI
jgi:hypothetical protein